MVSRLKKIKVNKPLAITDTDRVTTKIYPSDASEIYVNTEKIAFIAVIKGGDKSE